MKRYLVVVVAISVLLAAVVPLAGCSGITKIGDIQANPLQYEGKQVSVRGTTGDTVWFTVLSKGAYQIGDGSGTIWVVTTQPPPQKGIEISTRGTVSTAVKFGDRTFGTVITETKRG